MSFYQAAGESTSMRLNIVKKTIVADELWPTSQIAENYISSQIAEFSFFQNHQSNCTTGRPSKVPKVRVSVQYFHEYSICRTIIIAKSIIGFFRLTFSGETVQKCVKGGLRISETLPALSFKNNLEIN